MTEAEWAVCEPLLPSPAWLAGRGGRPARYCMRDIVDAIRYLTHNGPVWRALPADFPPAWTRVLLGLQMAGRPIDRADARRPARTGPRSDLPATGLRPRPSSIHSR